MLHGGRAVGRPTAPIRFERQLGATRFDPPEPSGQKRHDPLVSLLVSKCRPRPRGGGPMLMAESSAHFSSSPPTRGWSLRWAAAQLICRVVPAHAGVVLVVAVTPSGTTGRPRPRGGGPARPPARSHSALSSPPTRGWSSGGRPETGRCRVVPAHAGVVPHGPCPSSTRPSRPRPRGGGPPRPRTLTFRLGSSPPTRGWSVRAQPGRSRNVVVPAHAGVVRAHRSSYP